MTRSAILLCVLWAMSAPAWAEVDVPIYEIDGDGQAATCGVSEVHGLKADGDGFLAVRSGPGAKYRKLGELYNGDRVTSLGRQGKWVAIVRDEGTLNVTDLCANNGPRRRLRGSALGWVHSNWLRYLYP